MNIGTCVKYDSSIKQTYTVIHITTQCKLTGNMEGIVVRLGNWACLIFQIVAFIDNNKLHKNLQKYKIRIRKKKECQRKYHNYCIFNHKFYERLNLNVGDKMKRTKTGNNVSSSITSNRQCAISAKMYNSLCIHKPNYFTRDKFAGP